MKKLNWGHGILIVIIVCLSGILTLVYISSRQSIELLDDDYYPKGLVYQEQIEKIKNENALEKTLELLVDKEITIVFPSGFENPEKIKGLVWFYKASDKKHDLRDSIQLDSTRTLTFPMSRFVKGRYELLVDWSYNQKGYFFKEPLFIEKTE